MRTQTSKTQDSAKANPVSSQRSTAPQYSHPVIQLQQKIGNQAVQRLLQSRHIQAKLTIGAPNDKYEQEADRVADQVMRMPEPKVQRQTEPEEEEEEPIQTKTIANTITPLVQCQLEPEEEEEVQPGSDQETEEPTPILESVPTGDADELAEENEEEFVQPKSNTGTVPQVTPGIAHAIHSIKGAGQPLPASELAFFEPRFGRDFSNVRVHTDNHAARTAQSINARAFTLGRDVVLGTGQYSPGTLAGRKLLAHELVHVLHQKRNLIPKLLSKKAISKKNEICREITSRTSSVSIQRLPALTRLYVKALLYTSAQGNKKIGRLGPLTRVLILEHAIYTSRRQRHGVLVQSGQFRGKLGYINKGLVKSMPIRWRQSIKTLKPVCLVFFQNPERIGKTIVDVGAAVIRKKVPIWKLPNTNSKCDPSLGLTKISIKPLRTEREGRPVYIKGGAREFILPKETGKHYCVKIKDVNGKYQKGFIEKIFLESDKPKRRWDREIAIDGAIKVMRGLGGGRQIIYVDANRNCYKKMLPIEYYFAQDIIESIKAASKCTNSLIKEIRIFGHSEEYGLPGTGDIKHAYGIYLNSYLKSKRRSKQNWFQKLFGLKPKSFPKAKSTRTFSKAVKNYLDKGVEIYFHGCSTAGKYKGRPGLAEELASQLRLEGVTGAKVLGFEKGGPYIPTKARKLIMYPELKKKK